jgi:hypothetical protein
MCTPVLLGGAAVLGGGISGIGAWNQRNTNATNYTMQANGLQRDIDAEKEASAYEMAATRTAVQKTLGSARAGFAANGLALSGSAAQVLDDTAIEGELDIAAIRWNSDVKVGNLAYSQKVARSNAKAERAAGPLAFFGNVFSAAGSLA